MFKRELDVLFGTKSKKKPEIILIFICKLLIVKQDKNCVWNRNRI